MDGNILLSASPEPPTIFVQDITVAGSAPVHFRPTDAKSSVTCSAFHTYSSTAQAVCSSFLLGFRDGTLAVYEFAMAASSSKSDRFSDVDQIPGFSLHPTKLGVFRKLHQAVMGGVSAAEFLPGFRSRIVSIGHDGRCRLVDFEKGAQVLRT